MLSRRLAASLLAGAFGLGLDAASAADLPEIVARGTLRVLTSADEEQEMYNFKAAGEPGFERELIESFARLHHLNVESVPVAHFDDIIPKLQKGEGDVITGIIDTEARRKLIDFTVEVLPARHVVVSAKPNARIDTLDQFRKERVGVVKGTSWAAAVDAAGVPAAQIQGFPDRIALFQALKAGAITATAMSLSDFTLALRRRPELQGGLFLGTPSSAGWGVRKTDTKLHEALDDYLGAARKAAWSRLVVKYFGKDALEVLGRAGKQ